MFRPQADITLVLWAIGFVIFRSKIISTSEMDFSEFEAIEREKELIEDVKDEENKTWYKWIM